ncbi:P-loop containing nucleoside triphosphate hydrolase protein [Phyllosticta citrichinensis]|uniref:P-loop containing nucleoside triphosphate hydrolase protein n=1 Tax=Phyllosticta citrichinensis TaxID=1130410 RepID=A0ABR1XLV3_9PEZI
MERTLKWLLLADIHFKHHDLDRITQTAAWITSIAAQHRVHRVVVCGDLLTSRSNQPTHVLSSCYRFLESIIHDAKVPHVHVLLGNHDLAYRRDHNNNTTALDALRLAAPAVQLHWDVSSHVWDGRRVLMLPFREDQSTLTDAVAGLELRDAADTVAFAHLALHRAITQRHIVHPGSDTTSHRTRSVAYHGLTGPGSFASLARTFTGHFHCHQTILQSPLTEPSSGRAQHVTQEACMRGSVTYVGSPLQLTWADLWDEQRGVILLDPETLDQELIVNSHGVGFITVGVDEVLDGAVDPAVIRGRHVMLLGDLTRFRYAAARDKLVSLGARSIRSWSPLAPRLQSTAILQGLGTSTPASDISVAQPNLESGADVVEAIPGEPNAAADMVGSVLAPDPSQSQPVDVWEQATRYVAALDLNRSLEQSRDSLLQVGQRLLEVGANEQAEEGTRAPGESQSEVLSYQSILPSRNTDGSGQEARTVGSATKANLRSPSIFDARPRSLTITNFLGIQSTIHLNFETDIKRGLTFLVGENGSGKSTLVEAIVWCQFGRCLRSGLSANDVVNDKARRDCSVRMEFENGYAITRFRKHKDFGNRTIVEREGEVLPEFEKADARTTQSAIDELLCVNYNTFIRTVVLGNESATSFLGSTPVQRRDLILSVLGLEILDRCASTARRMLRELGDDMSELQSKHDGLAQTMNHMQTHIRQLVAARKNLEDDSQHANLQRQKALGELQTQSKLLDDQISAAQQQVEALLQHNRLADIRMAFEEARATIQQKSQAVQQQLANLEVKHSQLSAQKVAIDAELDVKPDDRATTILLSWLLGKLTRMQRYLHSADASLDSLSQQQSSSLEQGQHVTRATMRALLTVLHKVSTWLGNLTDQAKAIPAQLNAALSALLGLQGQRELYSAKQASLRELQATARVSAEKAATYDQIIETESAEWRKLEADRDALLNEMASLAATRDIFDFWAAALAQQKTRRVSSSALASTATASSSAISSSSHTFREFVLKQSLVELNSTTTQVLAILFENSRHASALTTGMLRSLFVGDESAAETEAGQQEDEAASASALDSSLSVNATLSYGKRSSGERKRIDLALLFALLYIGQARSPHRARYMLVDEVFDSLDVAGQTAVGRWCDFMADTRVSHIIVITHSEHLASQGVAFSDDEHEGSAKRSVLSARMGEAGVELQMDGRRVG